MKHFVAITLRLNDGAPVRQGVGVRRSVTRRRRRRRPSSFLLVCVFTLRTTTIVLSPSRLSSCGLLSSHSRFRFSAHYLSLMEILEFFLEQRLTFRRNVCLICDPPVERHTFWSSTSYVTPIIVVIVSSRPISVTGPPPPPPPERQVWRDRTSR